MSISKNKRPSSRYSSKDKDRLNDSNIIYEHVKRIDGQEVIRKHIKCGLLGRGGFANCYITENIETKRRAATKIVFKQQLKSHRTRLRLANQIKLHKALHHPNIVQFINCFQDKENVYIFLELCENQSLNQLIRIRNNFITPQIQSFLFGIVNGLKYIHSQKILHRDLKLGNIFIDSKFNIKIGDFGLATKLQFKKQCKRTVCGTPNYIAPQVLQGKGYHFEVDIWSIGVILYTLFYGIPPFQTEDANSTYQRIKQCDYIIPKYMNVPNQAISLIQKLLLKNPHERFTLDEILMSDFMKLGNGILKQLPSICSKKAPTKKQLNNTNNIKPFQQYCVNKPKIEQVNNKKDFVVEFEEILQDTFYYRLKNDLEALIEKDIRLIYKGPQNKYIIRSLTNNYEEEAKDCDFKYLFMAMSKKFNVIDTINIPLNPNGLVFINRIQRLKNGFIIRLSSENIQLLIQDSNYLISNNKVWQILNGKQKQLRLSKIANGTLKGNKNHVKIIERILSDIQNQNGSNFKQNRN